MKLIDLITIIMLIPVFALAFVMYIQIRRGKFKPKAWPRLLGIGAGVYAFVSSMVAGVFLRPLSELLTYTVSSFFFSLAFAIAGYLGGRKLAQRFQDKN